MDPLKKWHSLLAHTFTQTHTHTVIALLHYLPDARGWCCGCLWVYWEVVVSNVAIIAQLSKMPRFVIYRSAFKLKPVFGACKYRIRFLCPIVLLHRNGRNDVWLRHAERLDLSLHLKLRQSFNSFFQEAVNRCQMNFVLIGLRSVICVKHGKCSWLLVRSVVFRHIYE